MNSQEEATPDGCGRFARWLTPYADGELDCVHTLEVEGHLEACEPCREQLELNRAMRTSLQRVLALRAPCALRERIALALAQEGDQQPVNPTVHDLRAIPPTALGAWTPPASGSRDELVPSTAPQAEGGRAALVSRRYIAPVAVAAMLAIVFGAVRARLSDHPEQEDRVAVRASAAPTHTVDLLIDDLVRQHAHALEPETTELKPFEPYLNMHVQQPQLSSVGARYLGARVLNRAAMLQYMMQNRRRVSVLVFNPREVRLDTARLSPRRIKAHNVFVGRVQGYSVAASEQGGVGYAVASDLSDDETAQLVVLASR